MGATPEQRAAKVNAEFWRLAVLSVLTTLTVPVAGLVDTAMLGHLPVADALAGAAVGSVVFDYVFWSFGFLRMGTTGLAAAAVGEGDEIERDALLWRALIIGFVCGCGVLALRGGIVWAATHLLDAEPGVLAEGTAYIRARLWGAPFALANFALTGWLLGTARTGRALALAAVANLGNAALNWVFIGMLDMGAGGAGLATAAGQTMAFVVALALVPSTGASGPRRVWSQIWDGDRMRRLFSLGGDIVIRTICLVTAFAWFTRSSAAFGGVIMAGNAVLLRLLSVVSYVTDGAAHAVETLAGQGFAALRDRARVARMRRVLGLGLVVAAVVTVLSTVVLLAFPRGVVHVLTDIPEVAAHATSFIPWLLAAAGIGGVAYILDGFFLGLSRGKTLRNAMLLSFGLGFAPLAVLADLRNSDVLLWIAMVTFMAARVLTLGVPALGLVSWKRGAPPEVRPSDG